MGFMDLFSTLFVQENGVGNVREKPSSSSSSSPWGLSKGHDQRPWMINGCDQRLSMEEILMVAGEKFIQFSTNRVDGVSMLFHPYGSSISGLCLDDERDVEIMHSLLAAAENVSIRQFDAAARFTSRCSRLVSETGSPVQRLGVHFSAALEQKICRESGVVMDKKRQAQRRDAGLALGTNCAFLASHQQIPFGQAAQFAGMQAIIERVKGAKKVHLIDLQIRSGIQWTALIQGVAELGSLQRLKITAVGIEGQHYMEETGKRLQGFAESMKLGCFVFRAVYLADVSEFSEAKLEVEEEETVAVYSSMMLRSMISKPQALENMMRGIARMRPAVMVVSEVEANHNSPSFIDRFTEALLFYSAYFDCLEECMEGSNEYRAILEGHFFGEAIMNIVASEGEERVTRSVKVGVWREFFGRFGMVEVELSESAKYQARLVVEQFVKGRSCSVEFDGKGMIVGWKGTPIHSLTVWTFS